MAHSRVEKQLLVAATATTDTPGIINVLGRGSFITLYVQTSAGVSAGVITFEESNDYNYAGTWAAIPGAASTITTSAASTMYVIHVPAGSYQAIRARVSTNITGGSVSCWAIVSDS